MTWAGCIVEWVMVLDGFPTLSVWLVRRSSSLMLGDAQSWFMTRIISASMIENSIVLGLVEVGMCNGGVAYEWDGTLIGDELGVVW
jgi:hypothetical protein